MRNDRRFEIRAGVCGLSAAFLCIVGGLWYWVFAESSERLLSRARVALAHGRYAQAEQLALRVSDDASQSAAASATALHLAGTAALRLERVADAVQYLDRIPDDGSEAAVEAGYLTGEILLNRLYRLSAAEQRFRRALAQDPRHIQAQQLLAYLLGLCGRNREAVPLRLALLKHGAFTPTDLLLLALRDTAQENPDDFPKYEKSSPDDPLTQLGSAVAALRLQQTDRAELLLIKVIAAAPALIEARLRLGNLLLESGRIAEFKDWNRELPAEAELHSETWALRGDGAQKLGELRGAARCYWESLRRDPCHQRACYQLAQVLLALEEPAQAAPFIDRAVWLQSILLMMKRYTAAPDVAIMREAAELCEKLGLLWEAWGWSRAILEHDPHLVWAQSAVERLATVLNPDLPRTLPDADPTGQVDLSTFPLPSWEGSESAAPLLSAVSPANAVQFVDEAASAGLNFTYFNDSDSGTPGPRMFEFTGGGVAVLDYDGDGWPDIYLTQGCAWPPRPGQRTNLDRLYRNLGDGRFQDVTPAAELVEDRYSQGVTVGDYNCDGHPDLYVANLDANRLFRNNGDGTFSDASAEAGTGGSQWTTSCLLADLNGDAWPDIYAVNYLAGSDLFERTCRNDHGAPRICTPHSFEAAPDRFYLNLGDGRFDDQTAVCGMAVPNGKGLGIVAADFTATGRLSLFVANDTDANCYFVNETARAGAAPLFRECAITSGLALNREGRTQACMGVAVGDANADGLLDLFVTNYYRESNTLYLQQPGNLFLDCTQEAGLRKPSLPMLGFGTQFLDGELDGLPDLVVTNGHVGDFREEGAPFRMRPQYFRNRGEGRFEEVRGDSLGSYFQREYLGRSLARLDWNRDGREDFVISPLDTPVALLTNRTRAVGHFLAIQLRGVQSSRDAIGTTVRVTNGNQTWARQLTAGDGYQASNQRQLIFGLGACERVNEVIVHWPSGLEQRFSSPPVDAELLAVEGRGQLVRLP